MKGSEPSYRAHLQELTGRLEAGLRGSGFNGALIPSGKPPLVFRDDLHYPFRPNPWFCQWCPEASPGSLIVIRPGNRPLLLFRQEADYWHMPPTEPNGPWVSEWDVQVVRTTAEARSALPAGRYVLLGEPDADWEGLAEANPAGVTGHLEYLRAFKTPYELSCLAEASLMAARGHQAAEQIWRNGGSEFEVHLGYCAAVGQRDDELPYRNIIGFDRHGAVLHYQHLEREKPRQSRCFLIDAGASAGGYAADITRTWVADNGDFAHLVQALDASQQRLADGVRPGQDFRELHCMAHLEVGGLLAAAGIATCSAEQAVDSGVTRTFFPHGLGHLLGLQVHDVAGTAAASGGEIKRPEGHPYLRLTRTLEAGCVVTIEPGIYFIDLLLDEARADGRRRLIDWNRVSALHPYGGVRIEDNVVALPEGPRNLTREAFRTLGA